MVLIFAGPKNRENKNTRSLKPRNGEPCEIFDVYSMRKAWVKFGHFYKGTNDVFFIGWMEMNRGWSWRVLTGTNFQHIIRILSNSTQKELAIAQMLSLRKFACGAVKYHLAWMKNGIGVHWKAILTFWRWMLQRISNCIFHHWFPKTSPEFFLIVSVKYYFFYLLCAHSWQHLVFLPPSLCTQLAAAGGLS